MTFTVELNFTGWEQRTDSGGGRSHALRLGGMGVGKRVGLGVAPRFLHNPQGEAGTG